MSDLTIFYILFALIFPSRRLSAFLSDKYANFMRDIISLACQISLFDIVFHIFMIS